MVVIAQYGAYNRKLVIFCDFRGFHIVSIWLRMQISWMTDVGLQRTNELLLLALVVTGPCMARSHYHTTVTRKKEFLIRQDKI